MASVGAVGEAVVVVEATESSVLVTAGRVVPGGVEEFVKVSVVVTGVGSGDNVVPPQPLKITTATAAQIWRYLTAGRVTNTATEWGDCSYIDAFYFA